MLVPADGTTYTLTLAGEGRGMFTLDLEELEGDSITASSTVTDVPVTSETLAMLTLSNSLKSASALSIDEDGNGSPDFSAALVIGSTTFPSQDEAEQSGNQKAFKNNPHPLASTNASSTPLLIPVVPPPAISSSTEKAPAMQKSAIGLDAVSKTSILRDPSVRQSPTILSRISSFLKTLVHRLLTFLERWVSHQERKEPIHQEIERTGKEITEHHKKDDERKETALASTFFEFPESHRASMREQTA